MIISFLIIIQGIMRLFFSYAKSHIYELHAVIVAVVTIVALYQVKTPIKRIVAEKVDVKHEKMPEKKAEE